MSDSYRQSALLLHSLGEKDREWILAHLDGVQREQLTEQLTELGEIGMPPDRTLVESLIAPASHNNAAQAKVSSGAIGHNLRAAPANVMLHLLGRQPTWLIAAVLSIEAWPWREAIYVGLDASKRDRVRQALSEAPPLRLANALVAQLEARLPEAISECYDRLAPVTGFPFLLNKVQGWFRP